MSFRNCIICKNNDSVEAYCNHDRQLYVKCNSCGLIYVNDFANQSSMNKAYTGGGLKSFRRKLFAPIRRMRHISKAAHFTERAEKIFEFVKTAFARPVKATNYIDIGCNKGFLLEQGVKNEVNVYGVELVKEVMSPFKNSYPESKNRIFHERFSNVAEKFDDEFFDIITAMDVIEHFEDPLSDLKHIYRILKTDGVFVIQTPDVDTKEAIEQQCEWPGLKPLEHLHLFGKSNFEKFANDAGFSNVIVCEPVEYGDGNFMAIMRK